VMARNSTTHGFPSMHALVHRGETDKPALTLRNHECDVPKVLNKIGLSF
jgi:hypothetical protein